MNLRFRFAYFALSVFPVSAGDGVIPSAKGGLDSLPSEEYSSKGVIDLEIPTPQSKTRSSAKSGLFLRTIESLTEALVFPNQ